MEITIVNVLLALCGLYTAAYSYILYKEWNYTRRAKALGCAPPTRELSFAFGIPRAFELASHLLDDTVITYVQDLADQFNTIRAMLIGEMWLNTIDPENVKTILATSFKDYSLGFRYESFYPLLGNGIFTLSGEGWKHSRTMLRPQFSREQVSRMNSLREHINVLVDRFAEGSKNGNHVDAQVLYHCLTLDTATEFLFGASADTLSPNSRAIQGPRGPVTGQEFADSFQASLLVLALRVIMGPLYFLYDSFSFRRHVKVCHNFVDYFVYRALENPLEKDEVTDKYVFIQELTKETRDPVIIRDQAFNILLAGRDTTASLLSFITYYLGRDPAGYAKFREAILKDFGTEDANVTFESLKRSKYLQNVINEVLRLHPIVPINFRTAIRDTKLPSGGGPNRDQPIFVAKGTNVMYVPYAMQRNEKYWGKDGNEYNPDRWNDPETQRHTWDYVPFNGGPRICLGQQFALTEASYVLVRVAQRFKGIELLHPDPAAPPRELKQLMRLTISVSGGVKARFIPA